MLSTTTRDIACSLDPVLVYQSDYYSCSLSYIDYESYIGAECTGNLDTSDWGDDDALGGYEDMPGNGDSWGRGDGSDRSNDDSGPVARDGNIFFSF